MLQPSTVRKIIKELSQLRTDPPEDIRVQLDEEDVLQFVGIIAGPEGTPYHGGYFKVRFTFSDEFPAAPPKCIFTTKIFHPNVSPAGDICVSTLKKDWKPTYGITHILTVIKCLLIYPNPESALDEEAGKMLLDDYDGYCKRARLMTSIHATRGGVPPEFETTKENVQLSDPMGISFLDSLGPSDSIFSPSKSSRAPVAGPSTSSRPMIHHPTSPKRAAGGGSREASPSAAMSATPLSPSATTIPLSPNTLALSPTMTPMSPTLTPAGLTIPPLRSSAQSANGAARLSPAPSGPNEKDLVTSTSAGGAESGGTVAAKKGGGGKEGKDGVRAVKRPASAVSGGVKEKGNGAEKRKKGLKRL